MNHNFIDETGHVYGRLRVLRRSKLKAPTSYGVLWLCLCDPELGGCGAEVAVRGTLLRMGATKSCGCLRCDNAKQLASERWKKQKGEKH